MVDSRLVAVGASFTADARLAPGAALAAATARQAALRAACAKAAKAAAEQEAAVAAAAAAAASSSPSPPARQRGADQTDAQFGVWLREALAGAPGHDIYPGTFAAAAGAVEKWRARYHGRPDVWKRLMKERVVKEIIEVVPVVAAVLDFVAAYPPGEPPLTLVDLCCGKGYLSMLLSEVLPPAKVARSVLVDRAWPQCTASWRPGQPLPAPDGKINCEHLYGSAPDGRCFFDTWPVRLVTSCQDLKNKAGMRSFGRRVLDRAPGPVLVLAVHLCGTLSLRAVDLFNGHPKVQFMVLKPCCLPLIGHALQQETFTIGRHSFPAEDVCSHGRFRKDVWVGPPRETLRAKFELWTRHLLAGLDTDRTRPTGAKRIEYSQVQRSGGYQNLFVFGEHGPAPTAPLWGGLAARRKTRRALGLAAGALPGVHVDVEHLQAPPVPDPAAQEAERARRAAEEAEKAARKAAKLAKRAAKTRAWEEQQAAKAAAGEKTLQQAAHGLLLPPQPPQPPPPQQQQQQQQHTEATVSENAMLFQRARRSFSHTEDAPVPNIRDPGMAEKMGLRAPLEEVEEEQSLEQTQEEWGESVAAAAAATTAALAARAPPPKAAKPAAGCCTIQ